MTAITGVSIKKNAKSKATLIAIDLRKHPGIIPVLQEQGLPSQSDWEKESADCVSVEEAFAHLDKTIDNFYAGGR